MPEHPTQPVPVQELGGSKQTSCQGCHQPGPCAVPGPQPGARRTLRDGATSGVALVLSRSQALVTDEDGIVDPRVRGLADGIIKTQREEIAEMDWLLRDIEENGPATSQSESKKRPVPQSTASP